MSARSLRDCRRRSAPRVGAFLVGLAIASISPAASAADASLRAALQEELGFSDAEIEQVERGAVVKEVDLEAGARDVTIVGLTRIAAPVADVLAELRRPELLLDASFVQQIGRFGRSPAASDVESFRIPEGDLDSLRRCRVGDCRVKLQAFQIQDFQALDWEAPDARAQADALGRRALVRYARDYLARGNAALAVYADKRRRQSLEAGLARLLGRARYVEQHLPALDRHLREFPEHRAEQYEDELFWSVSDYGYRPVTEMIHAVVHQPRDEQLPEVVIALKHIFATHYLHARLEFLGLTAHSDRPSETSLIHVDRSLFDEDLGRLKRGLLVRGLIGSERKRLELLRQRIASQASGG
ncbi:MAG: hypothetical protein QNK03_24965 [Myxococcota bacterium]|nr:hypothetical protein [Myxococcota bacterium]